MAGHKTHHHNAPKQRFSQPPKQNFPQHHKLNGKIQKSPAVNKPKSVLPQKPQAINTKVTGPLFDRKKLEPTWKINRRIGPGLLNGMNTCFLNSVLQCLTYTPPLAQYLLTKSHRSTCKVTSFCALCSMEIHIHRCLADPKSLVKGAAIHPKYFTSNLKALSKTMRLGEQEDANEFLMFLFASFQKASTYGLGKLDPKVEESTLIHQIFGGRMQSQLRCYNCKATSSNYEAFLDLSIDLHKADTVQKALQNFIKVDIIGGNDPENKYMCSSCKQRVTAGKQMTLCELPMMLNIHLKRFTFDMQRGYMRKVTSDVKYPEVLDMAPYVSKEKNCQKAIYRLYAVLVHLGGSCSSGHYYAYVKSPEGKWYRMDDEDVSLVSLKEVLSQRAYMMFYAAETSEQKDTVPVADVKKLAEKSLKRTADVMEEEIASAPIPEEPKRQKVDTISEEEARLARKREKKKERKERKKKAMEAEAAQKVNSVEKTVPAIVTKISTEIKETPTPTETIVLTKEPTDATPAPISVNSDHPEAWVVRSTKQPFSSLRRKDSPLPHGTGLNDINPWVIGTDFNLRQKPQKMPKRWHIAQKWIIKDD
ncbi:hypothetical protein CLU79DRAFT_473510 [Phycomyces nitens]|nr:hypothetical protein CLU79DRAFT_473510 [Phycomyces nitens]